MNIREMTKAVHELAREKKWWADEEKGDGTLDMAKVMVKVGEKIALIHSELSEALEEYRKGLGVETYWDIPGFGTVTRACVVTDLVPDEIIQICDSILATEGRTEENKHLSGPEWRSASTLTPMAREYLANYITRTYKPEGFTIEIADAVIRCGDMLEAMGGDLQEAILLKHRYNETRSNRHGGKRC